MGWEHWALVSQKNNRALQRDRSKYFRGENSIVSKVGERLEGKASPEQLAEITQRMLAWNLLKRKKNIRVLIYALFVSAG